MLIHFILLIAGSMLSVFSPPSEAEIIARLKTKNDAPIAERLRHVSDAFVGAPYAVSPLGEGPAGKNDTDPRLRFDRFDCTTFVETVIALAHSENLSETLSELDAIRYREAKPTFLNRRHFPQAEWIPELIARGVLQEITREVAQGRVGDADKILNPQTWDLRKKPSTLELPAERIPNGTFHLDYWPLNDARKHQKRIPPGTVLNLVRVNYRKVPVRVSHQGLVIEKKGQLFLRHAADRMYHSVTDEPLDRFFHRMQQYKKWPVAGINLVRVKDRRQRAQTSTSKPAH